MGSKNICDSVDVWRGGSESQSQLILDSVKGELVKKAPARVVKKTTDVVEAKALAALKNHSEAEKRRRQRINAHLTTLRSLLPSSTHKMDKARLLAEVIRQMKELEKQASESCDGLLLPMDREEVRVEPLCGGGFKVSLCFKYRHDILHHLRNSITALQLRVVSMEMSSFQEWLNIAFIFFFTHCDDGANNINNKEMKRIEIHRAFTSVLEDNNSSLENIHHHYSTPTTTVSRKRRRRVSVFHSSSSSSSS